MNLKVIVVGSRKDFQERVVMPEFDILQVREIAIFQPESVSIKEFMKEVSHADVLVTLDNWAESPDNITLVEIARALNIDVVSRIRFSQHVFERFN